MKECYSCKVAQGLENFYRHIGMAGGYLNKCKECHKRDITANRAAKKDYFRAYDRKRANNPSRVEARAEYVKTDAGKAATKRGKRRYLQRHQRERAANIILNNAVRSGIIAKPSACWWCGNGDGRIHGHHSDYSSPLGVTWLCSPCHLGLHKEHNEMQRQLQLTTFRED